MLVEADNNRLVSATPFLKHVPGAAAHTYEVNKAQTLGVLLAAEHWDLADAATVTALRGSNLADHGIRDAAINVISSDLERHAILDSAASSKGELIKRITTCPEYDRTANPLRAADIEEMQPYDGGAGGAHPCPPEFDYLRRTTFESLVTKAIEINDDQPSLLLALAFNILGTKHRRATRNDEGSNFWAAAEMLKQQVLAWAHMLGHARP